MEHPPSNDPSDSASTATTAPQLRLKNSRNEAISIVCWIAFGLLLLSLMTITLTGANVSALFRT